MDIQLVWSGSTFFYSSCFNSMIFINVLTEINTLVSFVMSRLQLLPFISYTYKFVTNSLKDS